MIFGRFLQLLALGLFLYAVAAVVKGNWEGLPLVFYAVSFFFSGETFVLLAKSRFQKILVLESFETPLPDKFLCEVNGTTRLAIRNGDRFNLHIHAYSATVSETALRGVAKNVREIS